MAVSTILVENIRNIVQHIVPDILVEESLFRDFISELKELVAKKNATDKELYILLSKPTKELELTEFDKQLSNNPNHVPILIAVNSAITDFENKIMKSHPQRISWLDDLLKIDFTSSDVREKMGKHPTCDPALLFHRNLSRALGISLLLYQLRYEGKFNDQNPHWKLLQGLNELLIKTPDFKRNVVFLYPEVMKLFQSHSANGVLKKHYNSFPRDINDYDSLQRVFDDYEHRFGKDTITVSSIIKSLKPGGDDIGFVRQARQRSSWSEKFTKTDTSKASKTATTPTTKKPGSSH